MRDKFIMRKKELIRKSVFDRVKSGQENLKEASIRLGLSYRQTRRSYKSYLREGDEGLIHKSRGVSSSRSKPGDFKKRVLDLYGEKYGEYGPTLAAEVLLEEEGIQINRETLRLWLKAAGLWAHRRIRKKYRKQRQRKARFGDLVQLDGSLHKWLPDQEGYQCLINMVDDATGKTLSVMDSGETTRGVFQLLHNWIKAHGIPRQVYVDLKSLYVSPKALKEQEGNEDIEWLTHFSKACKALGIAVIKAYSPQAKGRVERNHAVYQDRLVKALKRKGIQTIAEANHLLYQGGFIEGLNAKFMKEPESLEDAHMPAPDGIELNDILSWSYERTVRQDYTLSFEATVYQIFPTKERSASPKQKVTVRKHLNGEVSVSIGDKRLKVQRLKTYQRPKETVKTISSYTSAQRSAIARENKSKSPWSRTMGKFFPNAQKPKAPHSDQDLA